MKRRVALILLLVIALSACQSAAPSTVVVTAIVEGTPMPAAPEPTREPESPPGIEPPTAEPTVPPIGISPPNSGGPGTAPTKAPTAANVIAGGGRTGWSQISAANPPPARYDHTLTLDTANNRLVLFGGRDGSKSLGDTWIFDLASSAWREVKASPAPEARFGHAAAFDPKSKRVLLFAGQGSGFFNDVWAFDAAKGTWQKLDAKGTAPAARYGTSAVVDTKRNALIISHGFASGRFDDTHALDLATSTWSPISAAGGVPLKRCLHESVYDAKSDRMILFGGCSSGYGPCPQGDVWSLNVGGRGWSEIKPARVKPSPRSNPSLVSDGSGRLILFGGLTRDGNSGEVWALDVAAGEWTAMAFSGSAPSARSSHDAVWNPATKQMIVFGGKGDGALNDLWVLAP